MKGCVWLVSIGGLCLMGCSGDGSDGGDSGWNPGMDIPTGTDVPTGSDIPSGTDINPGQDWGNGSDTGSIVPVQSKLYKSGSRIKAKVYKTADGAVSFLKWYDTILDVYCDFLQSPIDGKYRCLPYTPQATSFYSDSACTEPIIQWYTCHQYEWLKEFHWAYFCEVQQGCKWSNCSYYEKGDEYNGTKYFTKGSDGKCSDAHEISSLKPPGYVLYHLGKKIPASTFQEASVETMEP